VNIAERFAEGNATEEEVRSAIAACERCTFEAGSYCTWAAVAAASCGLTTPATHAATAARWTLGAAITQSASHSVESDIEPDPHEYQQVKLLYDVIGNPFRPVKVERDWLTSTVVALAGRFYQAKDSTLMPILADALQDAGCDSDDILDHCRGPGPHVRGCWVVDLILGKT
jgi:hypothetical protein